MISIKHLFTALFTVVLFTLILDNKKILSSTYNFYAFLFSITSVLVCIYLYRDDIEKFEEDSMQMPPAPAAQETPVVAQEAPALVPAPEVAQEAPAPSLAPAPALAQEAPATTSTSEPVATYQNNLQIELSESLRFSKPDFVDEFSTKFNKDGTLLFYISSFQKNMVDYKNNLMLNHIQLPNVSSDRNVVNLNTNADNILTQNEGLLINFKQPLTTMYPKDLKFNEQSFTIIWYAKFIPVKYDVGGITKNVFLINIPIHHEQNILGVEYEFQNAYVNPSIKIHWKGKVFPQEHNYVHTSIADENDKNKNYFDNKYHMFTLLKTSDNTLRVILDDQTLASSPLISTNINSALNDSRDAPPNLTNTYKITMNANVVRPTPESESDNPVYANVPLNCYLNALGIFNRAIGLNEINDMFKYFNDVKFRLDPRYVQIETKINKVEQYMTCPFSDTTLCKTNNCASILDWTDNSSIVSNDKCFKDVLSYCKSLDDYSSNKLCSFFDENNILKSASMINDTSKATIQSQINDEEELVNQLRKIGLNNIYLDKSLRAKGKYSEEINQLIDKIYEQKQLNLKGIQDLYDADSEELSITELEYDKLLNSKPKRQGAAPQGATADVAATSKEVEVKKEGDLMNLQFKDLESYDDIMRDYENTKVHVKTDVVNKKNDEGLLSKLTSWF